MDREQGNKIKVNESTQVGDINGIGIDAEDLQRWAYRRLETWPDLLDACKQAVCGNMGWKGKLNHAIAKAEKG